MDLIQQIFGALDDVIAGFGASMGGLFSNITQIFFVVDGNGQSTLTPIGVLSLCAFGIGLIWTGIRWLSRLIKMRG